MSLSPRQNLCLEARMWGGTKSPPSQPCGDPAGPALPWRRLHKPTVAHLIISKLQARRRRGHCQRHGSPRRVHSAIFMHRSHIPTISFLHPSKTQLTTRTVNNLHAACGPLMGKGPFTLIPISSPPGAAQTQALCLIRIRSLLLLLHFFSIKLHLHSIILRQSHPAHFQPPTGLLGLITDTSSYRVLKKKTCRN